MIPVIGSFFALSIGYLLGGMRGGRIATEQAYHSDLSYLIAVAHHLEENEIEQAKDVSKHAIQGALSVLDTFEDEPASALVFILPASEIRLDSGAKESIRSQANLILSEEAAAAGSIQSEASTPFAPRSVPP